MSKILFRFEYKGDENLIYIPNSTAWRIVQKSFDDKGYVDYGLYLQYDDKELKLRDTDLYCCGRDGLPTQAVGDLYSDIIIQITKLINENINFSYVCIEDIESQLLYDKFEKLWIEKGYIQPNKNGVW